MLKQHSDVTETYFEVDSKKEQQLLVLLDQFCAVS